MQTKLNGTAWFQAICAGAEHLIEHGQLLNKINVFPVADGDTGNNLTSLMRSILQYAKPAHDFYHTAQSIAKASLMGARGNSGTIFSQFFYGFVNKHLVADPDLHTFCALVQSAAKSAKQAVDKPVSGTILTVMEEWAKACEELKHQATTIADLVQKSLVYVDKALSSTTEKLEVLRRANVVDAGAQGFVFFLQGVAQSLVNPRAHKVHKTHHLIEDELFEEDHAEMTYPNFRYCTEALLCKASETLDVIKARVADLGDSMVIAGNEEACRLHIHTNDPKNVMERLQAVGQIEQQKADDMLRQYQMTQHLTRKIALVTDSTADIPQELIDHYQIHVIPLQLQVDQSFYLDRLTISSEQIYHWMRDENRKHTMTTSMPNPVLIERMLRQLHSHYEDVLVITLADQLSGTHKIIKSTAEKHHFDKIKVIDSIRASGALGLLVLEAAKMIEAQKPFQEIVERVEQLKSYGNIYVAVNDVQYMIRSGRLSRAKGHIVQALKLKPIIAMDRHGKAIVAGKALGFRAALDKLIEMVKTQKNPITDYAIVHADTQGIADRLAKKVEEVLGKPPLYVMPVSAVLGIHAGPGCVAIVTVGE